MFFLFVVSSFSQQIDINYTASFPINAILTYGFKEKGKYFIQLNSSKASDAIIILTKDAYLHKSHFYYCNERNNILRYQNCSVQNSNRTLTLSGSIKDEGVYKLFLISCSPKQARFKISCTFSNPDTLLDYRNRFIVPMFKYMSLFYLCLFSYWFAQYPILRIFKYPLHTSFMLLPLVRAFCMYIWYAKWKTMETTEKPSFALSFATHLIDVIYYTTYLSSLLFLCGGCNIYRITFSLVEHLDIILASFTLTIGIILIPIVSNEKLLMLGFALTIAGLVWYLSIGVTSMVKAARIVSLVSAKPRLKQKIIRSREIVSLTYLLSFITITVYIAMYLAYLPEFACAIVMEVGCLACIIIILWFYTTVPTRTVIDNPTYSNCHPIVLNTPCGKELVLLTPKINKIFISHQ